MRILDNTSIVQELLKPNSTRIKMLVDGIWHSICVNNHKSRDGKTIKAMVAGNLITITNGFGKFCNPLESSND